MICVSGDFADVEIVDALGPDLVAAGAMRRALERSEVELMPVDPERAGHVGQRRHRRPAAAVAADVLGHPRRRPRLVGGVRRCGSCCALSDAVDGYIARRHGATRSGAFLDPLADKVLVLGAMFTLVGSDVFWIVPVAIIAVREFVISIYRTVVGSRGVSVPASRLAKYKTLAQQLAVGFALLPLTALDATWLWNGVPVAGGRARRRQRRGSTCRRAAAPRPSALTRG